MFVAIKSLQICYTEIIGGKLTRLIDLLHMLHLIFNRIIAQEKNDEFLVTIVSGKVLILPAQISLCNLKTQFRIIFLRNKF